MVYDLSHLTQNPDQKIYNAIQDDEALLLYALCRTVLVKNVVELGVDTGYSALNFSKAVGSNGQVIGFDTKEFKGIIPNFTFLHKNAGDVQVNDIPWVIDLVFFDTHDKQAQILFFEKMVLAKKITSDTILVVHDTNILPQNTHDINRLKLNSFFNIANRPELNKDNIIERNFTNWLIEYGWKPLHLHTRLEQHTSALPFRNGLSILTKKTILV